jgi:hypothetical protein
LSTGVPTYGAHRPTASSSASTAPSWTSFFRSAFRTTFYESVEALQADLDAWLVHYNTERPHQGYRNLGRRPIDAINNYSEYVKRET